VVECSAAAALKQRGEGMGRGESGPMPGGGGNWGRGGGAGTTRSRAEGGSGTAVPGDAHCHTPCGGNRGGKGADRWAGATVPRFESIQTNEVIQTLYEFKF
jgi:hypothetical protein